MAHYEIQGGAGGLAHNPGACMTGTGWITLDFGVTEIAPGYPVNYLVLERSGHCLLVYWWNIHHRQWLGLSSDIRYELHSIYNALRNHRTDWALVRLITAVTTDKKSAEKRLTDFAHQIVPILPQFIRQEPNAE